MISVAWTSREEKTDAVRAKGLTPPAMRSADERIAHQDGVVALGAGR